MSKPSIGRRALLAGAAAWGAGAILSGSTVAERWSDGRAEGATVGPGRWLVKAPLSVGRAEVGVATAANKVYVLGGYANGRVDQAFNDEFDPASNTWRSRAAIPRGLNHVAAVGFNGRVYALGGFLDQNRNAVSDVNEYDVPGDRWRALAPVSPKRGAAAAVVLDGKIHLIGGRNVVSEGWHHVYDPATNAWTERAPLPQGRDHHGLAVVVGKIHGIGGRFNTFEHNTDLHDVYDPAADSWSSRAPLPTARSGVAAAVLNGWIFVFGGERAGGVFSENEAYDPGADRWMTMTPMRTPRHGTGAAVVGSLIYIPAGGLVNGGSRPSTTNEAFGL